MFRGGREQPEVLLIFRREVWDLPKGKREAGETPETCARREVAEEIGLSDLPEIRTYLTDTFHSYEEKGRHLEKQTFWYAMRSDQEALTPQEEEGIKKVEWMKLNEAVERVAYDNLRDVLNVFGNWLNLS